ncbi:hypothetical protein ABNF87_26940, partial [Citrobacter freundii]
GETPGIFIVLSGFATTDLSVRFRDACQGGGAYGKTASPWPYRSLLSFFLASSRKFPPGQ